MCSNVVSSAYVSSEGAGAVADWRHLSFIAKEDEVAL
jgi:hypothetical protein